MLNSKSLDELDERWLSSLVDGQVSEARQVEYKLTVPSEDDSSKKEFLADVSSFANASGGYLIIGMQAKEGLPTAVVGIDCDDADSELLRMENIVRDGLEPRVQGIMAKWLRLSSGRYAFVFRIPKSWSKPHVVNYRKHWRFYSRNSAGKYPLDVSEVRAAFVAGATLSDRIRLFRDERIGSAMADQLPMQLGEGGRVMLHLVPFAAFDPGIEIPLRYSADTRHLLEPIGGPSQDQSYNFDGLLAIGSRDRADCTGYVQVFRNGIIEAIDASLLRPGSDGKSIPSTLLEVHLIDALGRFLRAQTIMGVSPPISLMLSLVGVSGYVMAVRQKLDPWREHRRPIDRDVLLVPEVILEDYPARIAEALEPAMDAVWNAAGWPSWLEFDRYKS
jgi:hypothetical protein